MDQVPVRHGTWSWFIVLFLVNSPNSPGVIKDDAFLSEMMKDASGPLNFTMFLTFMGEKLQNTDTDDTLTSAFQTIDDANTGLVSKEK